MATLAEAEAHQAALASLTTLAIRDLVALWRSLDLDDAARTAAQVREMLPELLAAYSLAAGTMAADWYEDLRAEAAVAAGFTATAAGSAPEDAVQDSLGWALAPLFDTVEAEPAAALSRLSGKVQAAVAGADRATIIRNTRRDPTAVRYFRHASANACAFCAMLATRQAAYRSEQSAERVVGRGTAKRNDGTAVDRRRKGIRARGTQALGEKYHDRCRCIAVPVWPGDRIEEAPYVQDWRESYLNATEKLGGARDTKAILALMRADLGSH